MFNRLTSSSAHAWTLGAVLCVVAGVATAAPTVTPSADEAAFRDLYRELVEINTTLSGGSCTRAAEAMARRLLAAGIPADAMQVLAPPQRPQDGNLIATLSGRDPTLKPLLLLAHIDVVEAKPEDWGRDPFKLIEKDGFFYARGASDDKAMASVFTDSLIRYRKEGFKPRRSIRLALTCGEESPGVFNGVKWLLETHPQLLQANFALNEGAGGLLDAADKPVSLDMQAGEKTYQDYVLKTTNPGGHSSRPTKTNAINQLAAGLTRLAAYQFPVTLNDTTRAYFEQQSKRQPPEIADAMRTLLAHPDSTDAVERLWAANPSWNGMVRTTCVATQIEGGHAPNALPQSARANVNCRILPGVTVDAVMQQLKDVIADDGISISSTGEISSTAVVPPLTANMMGPARKVAGRIWPGTPIVPTMATGATDGRYLNAAGIPTYGLSGMFHDAEGSHAHGLNERIRVVSLLNGRRFLYEVVKLYADQQD